MFHPSRSRPSFERPETEEREKEKEGKEEDNFFIDMEFGRNASLHQLSPASHLRRELPRQPKKRKE